MSQAFKTTKCVCGHEVHSCITKSNGHSALVGANLSFPPPPRDVFGVVFVDSEKITFLDTFDMYFMILVIFIKYLVIFS